MPKALTDREWGAMSVSLKEVLGTFVNCIDFVTHEGKTSHMVLGSAGHKCPAKHHYSMRITVEPISDEEFKAAATDDTLMPFGDEVH